MIPFTSGRINTRDGASLYYESRGQGQPVILVYGLACPMNHWHFQVEEFSRSFQVITYDLRGHHQSGVSQRPFQEQLTLKTMAEDLEDLEKSLQLQNPHVVGHSYGVPILFERALKTSKNLKTLTAVNGFARNPLNSLLSEWTVLPLFRALEKAHALQPGPFQKLWKLAVQNPVSAPVSALLGGFNWQLTQLHDIEIYLKGLSTVPLEVFFPLFQDLIRCDYLERLAQIKIPTLIVGGAQDLITPPAIQKEMADKIVGSKYSLVPYGSHCTQLDFPEYLNLLLKNHFLE